MKSIIIIFATIFSSQTFGQSSSDNFYDKFPNSIMYASDSIKEIYVLVSTRTMVESDIDTILKLDSTKIKTFVLDFNRNIILPEKTYAAYSYYERVTAKQSNYGEKMYELVFISKTNNKTFYYIKKNFIGLSVLDTGDLHTLHSSIGQIALYYKMHCRNILRKYNLTYEQNSTRH